MALFSPSVVAAGKPSGSLKLDGASDYVSVADSSAWAFGGADFTLEMWVRPRIAQSNNSGFWSQYVSGENRVEWHFDPSAGVIRFQVVSSGTVRANYSWPLAPATGVWTHLLVERVGTTMHAFQDGVLMSKTTTTAFGSSVVPDLATPPLIGVRGVSVTAGWDGHIDDVRVSNGARANGSAFTPPTAPYASDGNTLLLLPFDDGFVDKSSSPHTVTAFGDAQIDGAAFKF
jgi:hypothetical protein